MPTLKKPAAYDSIYRQSYLLKNLLTLATQKRQYNRQDLKAFNTLTFKQLQDACRYLLHTTRLKLDPLARFHIAGVALFYPISIGLGVTIPFLQSACTPYIIGVVVFTAIIAITSSAFIGRIIQSKKPSLKHHNSKRKQARTILKKIRLFARNEKTSLKKLSDKPVLTTIARSHLKQQPQVPVVVVESSN